MFRTLVAAFLATLTASAALAEDVFPVTITHAFGETMIEAEPQRIVTWGWGNNDALLALGIVPVAMPFSTYGGGDNGLHPWVEDRLAELGAETPIQLPDTQEIPFEQIAAADPDVIVAVFSGISAEDYALLSQIAPTVAYSGDPWSTPWREVQLTIGRIVGRSAEAEALIAGSEAFLAAEVAKYPALTGTTFAAFNDYEGSIAVYAALDARVKFLTDLGLVVAPSVAALAPDDGSFFYSLSYELFGQLTSDILITFYETEEPLDALLAQSFVRSQPQYQDGALAALVGTEYVAAVSPPTVLSLRWGFPKYAEILGAAALAASD
jgi:iron complex transport system substrate-binding protein